MTLSALADPRVLAEEGDRSRCESTDRRQSFSTMFRPGATPELQTLTAWWATNMPAVSQPGSHITAAEMIGYPVDKSTKQIWSESIGGNTDEKLRKLSQKSYAGWFYYYLKAWLHRVFVDCCSVRLFPQTWIIYEKLKKRECELMVIHYVTLFPNQ